MALKMKLMSPMIGKVVVDKQGSGRLRKKLNHIPELSLSAGKLLEPIIKGRGYKPRAKQVKQENMQKKEKNSSDGGSAQKKDSIDKEVDATSP